ncbi:MAG: DinB family protein [Vicinamibacterales bacterium]
MDAQIEGYLLGLTSIIQDLPGLTRGLSPAQFNWRRSPGQWSIGQCVEHLNITTERYLPVIRKEMAAARTSGLKRTGPFEPGLLERTFLRVLEPPVKMKAKAPAAFVAPADLSVDDTLGRWERLNADLAMCIREADGIDLRRVKVRSQFGPLSFTLGATFLILLAHDRRHIWQARQVRTDTAFPPG